ncbi:hypothetical protein SNE40_021604 [Patella caerulea]|uniref:DNA mismatch repair protein n=1 Tax=Patella caerulea TaxID=87958 RepID=A0AAN8GJ13_PATCE
MSAKKAQPNTLFSYFSKTPPAKNNANHVLSPKKSPNSHTKNPAVQLQSNFIKPKNGDSLPAGTPRPSVIKTKNSKTATPKNKVKDEPVNGGFELYDVVWAKLEGYPWWPSLVCNHPTANKFYKGGKVPEIHVQFFDNPTSRAWVRLRNIKPFKGSKDSECQKGGTFYMVNTSIFGPGLEQGDKALAMNRPDRSELLVELQPSSDEDGEEEDMELDPEIFDDEMSDEGNNSKENHQDAETKTPKKTPVKRSGRPERSVKSQKKRRKIMPSADSDEESGDEFKPVSDDSDDESGSSGVDEDDISDLDEHSEPESPIKQIKKRKREAKPSRSKKAKAETSDTPSNKSNFQPNVSINTKSKLSLFSAPDSTSESGIDSSSFPHLKHDFLQPENIRDIQGRKKSDPEYDPRTLKVPEDFLKKQTPAMKQWWELKSQYFDTVLFFKMGKFYELFHMDSVIVVNELGLIYMKGEHAHSGFPEIAYSRYADSLIAKGYKVGRCEQTETPDMMAERCKQMTSNVTKYDKVVRRELCQISSQGTKTYQHLDGDCTSSNNNYLLAVAEKSNNTDECSIYGVCFVDTSIGTFHVGQFMDDRHCSRLRTLIAHHTPSQVLYERGKLSQHSMTLINTNLTSIIKESLSSGSEFWDSNKTLKVLAEADYFKEKEEFEWPETLKAMLAKGDSMGMTAADDYELAVSALGAMTWYLQYCLLDEELLSMKKFEEYKPLDRKVKAVEFDQKHMVIDGITLTNLDVAENSVSGDQQGTLLHKLNFCSTPFGKRLFRNWMCAPLCRPAAINDRLDAVDDLMASQELVEDIVEVLKKIPDLERLLSRIHVLGSANRSKHHPDSRAILYEEVTYSKRKIEDFLSTLGAFESSLKIIKKCQKQKDNFKSKLLKKSVTMEKDGGHFPDIAESLKFFEAAFDHDKAKKDGIIIPTKGVDEEYDTAVTDILSTEDELNTYLDSQRKALSCRAIVYWGTGKNRYQMEIPEVAVPRIPDDYNLMSSKKGWKRYRTTEIDDMLVTLTDAEDRKDAALKDVMRRLFHSFDERHKEWSGVVECMSVLDVLISMSKYSRCSDGVMCRPEFIMPDENTQPFIEIREGRHPCITKTFGGSDFIPNDTVIGTKDDADDEEDGCSGNSKVVLVTGPNMGGKSTLMRQVGLITVIAQMGCYVPAEKCRLTPIDRIFTRLGASDRIMSGESTFYVELSETSAILQHATKHSLVLVDELGRGTATYDGTAIACSVVEELSRSISCRTLFSTHYHSLVEQFSHDQNIRLGHMACMVENETEDPSQETITFLYKFVKGACPKSYGFNAARLADLPEEVIKCAINKAKEFEETVEKGKLLRKLWNGCSKDTVEKLITQT